jgi:RimJ/RimL family protein N-acetyltransferase
MPAIDLPLHTPRLVLRQWRDEDERPYAALNRDPEVMRYFPALGTDDGSRRAIAGWRAQIDARGWSNWAVERRDTGELIGFVGLTEPVRVLPFTPCIELGWRLARAHWGAGYATEAAQAALRVGFDGLGIDEIVSVTARVNAPSIAVMQRLGMTSDAAEDFEHPALPPGHALRPHVLYRLARAAWRAQERAA